jgi:DNA topoisomerase-1
MRKALIIVESPTKIKTLKKIAGRGYSFESSVGHIRDLRRKALASMLSDFEPQYAILPDKKDVIKS